MRPSPCKAARSGFTMIEAVFAVAIFAMIVGGTVRVLESNRESAETMSSIQAVENQGRRALGQLVAELRDASKATLAPTPTSPFSTMALVYQVSEGTAGGVQVLGPPRRIRFVRATGQVLLTRDVGGPNEMTTTLFEGVTPFLEGETIAAGDENGNGLTQEAGLCFTMVGQLVQIRLTLQRAGPEGQTITRTVETEVYCRN